MTKVFLRKIWFKTAQFSAVKWVFNKTKNTWTKQTKKAKKSKPLCALFELLKLQKKIDRKRTWYRPVSAGGESQDPLCIRNPKKEKKAYFWGVNVLHTYPSRAQTQPFYGNGANGRAPGRPTQTSSPTGGHAAPDGKAHRCPPHPPSHKHDRV